MINPKDLTESAIAVGRGTVKQATGLGGRVLSETTTRALRLRHAHPAPKDLDDVTLARKVESEAFRGAGVPKSTVKVSAADGVVTLRGTVKKRADAGALERRVRAVPEVAEVDNQLRVAPARKPAAKRTTAAGSPARTPRPTGGRTPAPMGSTDPDAATTPGEKVEAELAKGTAPGSPKTPSQG
jgi:hypothetical protein